MSDYYILLGREVVPADMPTWARWFENMDNRRVSQEHIGDVFVSTVFLGLDHRFGDDGPPLLFETMTFGQSDEEQRCERRSTYDEAEAQHARIVAELKAKNPS